MIMMNRITRKMITVLSAIIFLFQSNCTAQKQSRIKVTNRKPEGVNHISENIIPGAERMDQYLHLLKGKGVAIFANPTSGVAHTHLVDTLRKRGVNIKVIFGPEHGFRGTADAGEKVESSVDKAT